MSQSLKNLSTTLTGKINSHNEWDPLREVIVGTADGCGSTLAWNRPKSPSEKIWEEALKLSAHAFPQWYVDEIAEDLDKLADLLSRMGVKVYRPQAGAEHKRFSSPYWHSVSNDICNARDLHLIVGNSLIGSASPRRSRYYEDFAFYPIWYEYFKKGFRWIMPPKPCLIGDVLTPYYRDEHERELSAEDLRYQLLTKGRVEKLHKLSEDEILFETANTLRMGKDLLYLVSTSGNALGAQWLQSALGDEYRVHTTDEIFRASHIDATIICLRPGLVLLNSARVNKKNCPKIFDKWDKIYFSDVAPASDAELDFQKNVRDPLAAQMEEMGFTTNLKNFCSPWVGMNIFSIDPQTVIVGARQTNLISVLEKRGFTVIPMLLRHCYTQGGGFHCATLDTVRESKLEDYFS
jgi:glycine amidinotransferase